jgi:hypothetical protein
MVNTSFTRDVQFPPLPIEEWEDTKNTLHLFLQIVGKIRLALFPKMNHWWHVSYYISVCGLTTGPIPYEDLVFEIEFNFRDRGHVLRIATSEGDSKTLPLKGLSVAGFYNMVFSNLNELGIMAGIRPMPYDIPWVSTEPFAVDYQHVSYDEEYVNRFWRNPCTGLFDLSGFQRLVYWEKLTGAFFLAPCRPCPDSIFRQACSCEGRGEFCRT